jgi:hypothetical protein
MRTPPQTQAAPNAGESKPSAPFTLKLK